MDSSGQAAGPNQYRYEVVNAIAVSLQLGNTRRSAAEAAGVHYDVFCEWLKDDARLTFGYRLVTRPGPDGQPQTVKVDAPVELLRNMIRRVEEEGASRCVAIISKSAKGGALKRRITRTLRDGSVEVDEEFTLPNFNAAAWLLERKYPQIWAQRKREGEDFSHLSDQELLDLLAENEAQMQQQAAKGITDGGQRGPAQLTG